MAVCVPIRDLKNTSNFADLVNEQAVVTVTKNGKEAFHCLSNSEYDCIAEDRAKLQLLSRIMLAEKEIEEHKYVDYEEDTKQLRDKYGL